MIIAIDLDGVLANYNKGFLELMMTTIEKQETPRTVEYYRAYSDREPFRERMQKEYERYYAMEWGDPTTICPRMWDWSREMVGREINDATWKAVDKGGFWNSLEPFKVWIEVFKQLQPKHTLYFVTNRRSNRTCVDETHEWLEAQGFANPLVIYAKSGYKGWAVAAIGADVFIDDYYKNCTEVLRSVGTTCKVLLKDWHYNRSSAQTHDSNYIRRIFTVQDFVIESGLDIDIVPEMKGYGRNAKRQWESTITSRTQRGTRGSQQGLPEWDGEIREGQLAAGDGVDTILGRIGEASRTVVGRTRTSFGLGGPSSGTLDSESNDVVAVDPQRPRVGHPPPVGRLSPVFGRDEYTDETGVTFTGMQLYAYGITSADRRARST